MAVSAPARREVVREMVRSGLSERRALTVVHMSADALRATACSRGWPSRPERRTRASESPLRRRHDLPDAAPGRPSRESPAGRSASRRTLRKRRRGIASPLNSKGAGDTVREPRNGRK